MAKRGSAKTRYRQRQLQGRAEWWESVGELQYRFLLDHSLQPEHYLLDVGCGTFRVGRFLIDYLDTGHYYGVDKWQEALDVGIERVLEVEGLMGKKPQFAAICLETEDNSLATLFDQQFDVIWAHSLFVHLGPGVVRSFFESAQSVLAPPGTIYATAFVSDQKQVRWGTKKHIVTNIDREFWHYPLPFLEEAMKVSGLKLIDILDYDHPYQMKMLEIQHA